MTFLIIFAVILLGLGMELVIEGVDENNKFRPRYKTKEGDKEILVGIVFMLMGISTFIALAL